MMWLRRIRNLQDHGDEVGAGRDRRLVFAITHFKDQQLAYGAPTAQVASQSTLGRLYFLFVHHFHCCFAYEQFGFADYPLRAAMPALDTYLTAEEQAIVDRTRDLVLGMRKTVTEERPHRLIWEDFEDGSCIAQPEAYVDARREARARLAAQSLG